MNKATEHLREEVKKLWEEKKWDELIPVATELTNYQEAHDEARTRCTLGYVYILISNFDHALKEFNIAVKRNPSLKFINPLVYIASQISEMNNLEKEQQNEAFKIYSQLLLIVDRIKKVSFYNKEAQVAHYTSLHTLKNLSETKSCFRLYNADYMNDPEEGLVLLNIMNEEYQADIEMFYKDGARYYRSPAYIGSFVRLEEENEQKDKLFLWRTYGRHDNEEAAGVCLIFNDQPCFAKYATHQFGPMQEHSNNMQEDWALYEIHYRSKPNKELEKEEKLKKELEKLGKQLKIIEEFIKKTQPEEIKNGLKQVLLAIRISTELRRLVCELLDSIRFLFKENHYCEEKEVRVIQLRYGERSESSESQTEVDAENIPPRFYLEAQESLRFSEVILGPKTRNAWEWEQWLRAKAREQNESIDIKQSEIKYGKS